MTPATDPDLAALFRGVLDSPRLKLPKLVLADYLDERGEHVLAHAFRWCAAHGRHPHATANGSATGWFAGHRGWRLTPRADRSRLPWAVAQHFDPASGVLNSHHSESRGWYGPRDRCYATPWDHFAALAAALEEIAAVVRLPRD